MSDHPIERFNALPRREAEERLYACLANRRWAARVVGGRPYGDVTSALGAAEAGMRDLTHAEWLHAFMAHPRIGERGGDAPASSETEQSRVMQAGAATLAALAAENRQYEERFGHVFLIAAGGRSADEILAELRRRVTNDPARELDEATRELRTIARIRLEKLLSA